MFNLRGDDGASTGGLAVDTNLGWKGAEKYVATVPQVFDLWQDPQERYDIFMNNYTERTWTMVHDRGRDQEADEDLREVSAAQAAEHGLRRARSTISKYQQFQWVREQLGKGRRQPCRCRPETDRIDEAGRHCRGAVHLLLPIAHLHLEVARRHTAMFGGPTMISDLARAWPRRCILLSTGLMPRSPDRCAAFRARAVRSAAVLERDRAQGRDRRASSRSVTQGGLARLRAGARAHRRVRQ